MFKSTNKFIIEQQNVTVLLLANVQRNAKHTKLLKSYYKTIRIITKIITITKILI